VIFDGTIDIQAEAPRVWDFLLDVHRVSACMPGVQDVVQIDDRTFDGVITASVGPIAGKFAFRAHIVESTPPTELRAEIDGSDSVTRSTVHGTMAMTLHAVDAHATSLTYRTSIDIHGRLAILGEMVLRATATLLVEEFTRRLRTQLEDAPASPKMG
jgi:carbon monoxide dehydrogenase subunit G